MKYVFNAGLASIVFALAGCSATGPIFQQAASAPDGKGLIYLYRPSSMVYVARSAQFFVDGQKVAELRNNGYTVIYLPEGYHRIQQCWFDEECLAASSGIVGSTKTVEIPLDVKAGNTQYIRFSTGTAGYTYNTISVAWRIGQVSSVFGSREITETRYEPSHQQ